MNGIHLLKFLVAITVPASGFVINNSKDYKNIEPVIVITTEFPVTKCDENVTHSHSDFNKQEERKNVLGESAFNIIPHSRNYSNVFLNLVSNPETFVNFVRDSRNNKHGSLEITNKNNAIINNSSTSPWLNKISEINNETISFKSSTPMVSLETDGPETSTNIFNDYNVSPSIHDSITESEIIILHVSTNANVTINSTDESDTSKYNKTINNNLLNSIKNKKNTDLDITNNKFNDPINIFLGVNKDTYKISNETESIDDDQDDFVEYISVPNETKT